MNGSGETDPLTPQERDTAERRPWTAPRIIDSEYVSKAEANSPHPLMEPPPTSSSHS
jgi:hypothetical protein